MSQSHNHPGHKYQTQLERTTANKRRSEHAKEQAPQSLELFALLSKPASIGNTELAEERKDNTATEPKARKICPICLNPRCPLGFD